MKKLEGRVAIVTGPAPGVGRGLAKVLAENGAKICACARRVEKLEELKAEVEGFGGEVLPVACDVTDVEQINHVVVQCVERFGGIDILINCAQGAMQYREINDVDEANTLEAFESGPLASMMFMKACFPYLKESGHGASSTPPPRPVTTATRASAPYGMAKEASAPSPARRPTSGAATASR